MKLRLHGNSLRLRLSQGDVARLIDHGSLEEAIEFAPDSRFIYALETSEGIEGMQARYDYGSLRIQVPRRAAVDWARADSVGISGTQASLSILIEKDFKCLHGDSEDADAYPNPMVDPGT